MVMDKQKIIDWAIITVFGMALALAIIIILPTGLFEKPASMAQSIPWAPSARPFIK
jgi:hypothetical protein